MTPLLLLVVGLPASLAAGLILGRRLSLAQSPVLAPADLADGADPALALVLRANRGLGVWVTARGGEPARRAIVPGLSAEVAAQVGARLGRLAALREGTTELLDAGTLLVEQDEERAGAMLMPGGLEQAALSTARRDLRDLLDRLRREPVLAMVRRSQDRPDESVESVAMRLAHQIERLVDGEVAVALARPQGVQVLGVSLRSDPRLLLALAAPGSALERVGRGVDAGPALSDDPLGRAGSERRRARPTAMILAVPGRDLPLGAVVVAAPGGGQEFLLGPLQEMLRAAGPRLEQALDRQEMYEIARRDPLTGLRNRRGLEEVLGRQGTGQGALVYADIDHFKRLNDTLGHAAGDAALVQVARLVGQAIRSGDVAARIGGEELAVWLPGATLLEGTSAAERIRTALEEHPWSWQGTPWPLTASFGVAACPETVPVVANLPMRADQALYQAKAGGRNRVVAAI